MGPRLVWRDLGRSVRGAVAFGRYLRSRDTIDIALGLFEAASSGVTVGRSCRYTIRIANISEKVWDVKLTVEISLYIKTSLAAEPCARFTKHCSILPSRATEIEFHYDWRSTVTVMVDKVTSPPDACWQRQINDPQRYIVSAILADHNGKHLDTLEILPGVAGVKVLHLRAEGETVPTVQL